MRKRNIVSKEVSARGRLLDRLKSKKPTEHQQNSASKSCLDTDSDNDGVRITGVSDPRGGGGE